MHFAIGQFGLPFPDPILEHDLRLGLHHLGQEEGKGCVSEAAWVPHMVLHTQGSGRMMGLVAVDTRAALEMHY